MKTSLIVLVLVLLPVVGHAQTAPNRRDVVEAVSAADPARFACAHTGRSCEADWIKAVAWALHQTDPAWGLNGKRGDQNVLSLDVVAYRVGPTDRHVVAFDICGACGGGNPSVVWSDITNRATIGQPGTAIWVRPKPVGGIAPPTPGNPPVVTPPAPPVNLQPILDALAALAVKVDAVAGVAVAARDAAQSAEHDARELNAARLDGTLVPLKPAAIPCLTGRVPKAFGGSTDVTFCPVAQ